MSDRVTLTHPDLPDAEYTASRQHAEVLAGSGWQPKKNEPTRPEKSRGAVPPDADEADGTTKEE
jgi:hypothetical protein